MKKIIALIIVTALFISTTISAGAVDFGCDVDTTASAIYVENLDTNTVILDKASDQKMYPASTTKIMTFIVTAENVSDWDSTYVTIKQDVIDWLADIAYQTKLNLGSIYISLLGRLTHD